MRLGFQNGLPQRHLGLVLGVSMWLTSILALYNGVSAVGIIAAVVAIWGGVGVLMDLGTNPPGRLIVIAFLLILQSGAMAVAGMSMLAGVDRIGKQKTATVPNDPKKTR